MGVIRHSSTTFWGARCLKINLVNPESTSLRNGIVAKFSPVAQEGEVLLTVESVKEGGRIKFAELNDCNRAELFRQAQVYIKRSDFPDLEDNELYLIDLIGFIALSQEGLVLGEVTGFYCNGAQDVMEIRRPNGRIAEVPYVKQLVPIVDVPGKTVIITAPMELFDEL